MLDSQWIDVVACGFVAGIVAIALGWMASISSYSKFLMDAALIGFIC